MPDSITLLHISDMQFGRNHRFGRLGLPGADAKFDTLFSRLTDDLKFLRDGEYQLKPDVLVVSGDLAEWGLKKEFDDAREFVEKLTEFLNLPDRSARSNCNGSKNACRNIRNEAGCGSAWFITT